MRNISFITLVLLLLASTSYAATATPVSSFPWSTSFGNTSATITYDSGTEEEVIDHLFTLENQSLSSSLSAAANHTGGTGSMGYRVPISDGTNGSSGVCLGLKFQNPQPEFWMRFYVRYPTGFRWSSLDWHKWVYFGDNGTSDNRNYNSLIFEPAQDGAFRIIAMPSGTGGSYYGDASPTWFDTFAGGGTTSDGSWHYVEFHVKMDTTSSPYNGVAEYWIDGTKHMIITNANFSGGETAARQGWTLFRFNTNQSSPNNSGGIGSPSYVDYDDVVISTTGYIGPIGGGSGSTGSLRPGVSASGVTFR